MVYTREEEERLALGLRRGAEARCPRCHDLLSQRPVQASDAAYVRDRIWFVCGGCAGSVVFDRRRITPTR